MNSKDFKELLDEETKWLLESEFKKVKEQSQENVDIQFQIFSMGFIKLIAKIKESINKKQAMDSYKLSNDIIELLNGKEAYPILLALSFVIAETMRKGKERSIHEL